MIEWRVLGVVDKGWVALQIRQPRKEELQDSEAPVRLAPQRRQISRCMFS